MLPSSSLHNPEHEGSVDRNSVMISDIASQPLSVPLLISASGALLFLYYLVPALLSPLGDVKGPALARYTRLWELYHNWQGQLEHVTIALHKKYGTSAAVFGKIYILTSDSCRPHRPVSAQSIQHWGSLRHPHDLWPRFQIQQI